MVFPVKYAYNSSDEVASVDPEGFGANFRFFATARDYSDEPQWDLRPSPSDPECGDGKNSSCAMACDAEPCNRWLTLEQASANNHSFLYDFSAVCFLTVRDIARMHTGGSKPVALIQSAWGGTRVEAWMPSSAIDKAIPTAGASPPTRAAQNNASVLYNAMVAPWNKFAVRAALWYQGEANADQKIAGVDQTQYYAAMYQSMISSWRDLKGMGDFAFMTVQLPPSVSSVEDPSKVMGTGRMQIRLAEAETAPRPNGLTDISGVAVALDCGGKSAWGWDHPPNKNEISRRLALQTVHAAFAVQGRVPGAFICPRNEQCNATSVWTGPLLQKAVADASSVTLEFDGFSAQGLQLQDVLSTNPDGTTNNCSARKAVDGPSCCDGMPPFELWDAKTKAWVRAKRSSIQLKQGHPSITILSSNPATKVRYAWADYVDCVLVNSDGLPAGPFVANVSVSHQVLPTSRADTPAGGLIQSPPMGTNTWNYYHCNIDENIVKRLAQSFNSNGMAKAGYQYINIDDCWMVERLPNGSIVPDPARFPSGMRALSDYVHSQNLMFGLYTARGSGTCQGRPGSLNHELIDAATYCSWGLDYIKIDGCRGAEDANTSWSRFHQGLTQCLQETGRQIVQSVESCDSPSGCGTWVTKVANLWRTGGDVQNFWGSILHNAHANDKMQTVAVPGHFNDPDMLQVGNVGLTVEEQKSHFSLWAIMSGPLLAGTDIEHASAQTLAILTAPELIEINQDLGIGGRLQGKYLGPLTAGQTPAKVVAAPSPRQGHAAILSKCDGGTDQQWQFVSPDTGAALVQPPLDTSVHVRNQATGKLLDVPRCERAAEPYGPGPVIECGTGANSSCGDANQLWQFHANGTITTNVDGQCINAYGGTQKLQTFSCARQGTAANGLFSVSSSGEIKSKDGGPYSAEARPFVFCHSSLHSSEKETCFSSEQVDV